MFGERKVMNLQQYFEQYRVDPLEFAMRCKICVASVYRYKKGERPHLKTAMRIERATKHLVSVEDLMGRDKIYESKNNT